MSSRNAPPRALRDDTKNRCAADYVLHDYNVKLPETSQFKVARYSFSGQYLPSLSINYVAINKDLEKLSPQLY